MSEPRDERYDTAQVHVYAANILTLFNDLLAGGMTRNEALAIVLRFMRILKSS